MKLSPRLTPIALATASLLFSASLLAQVETDANSSSVFRASTQKSVFVEGTTYALMAGQQDITAFMTVLSENSFEVDLKGLGLQPGVQSIELLVPDAEGQASVSERFEIDVPANVAQPQIDAGAQGVVPQAQADGFKFGITLGAKARFSHQDRFSATPAAAPASAAARNTYADLTSQIALNYNDTLANGQLSAQGNLVGSSYRAEAVRFADVGNAADKLDLASYDIQWRNEKMRLSLGHISTGTNPLLANNIGNRGLAVNWQLSESWDVSASMQSGVAIVGFPNPTGLVQANNHINLVSTGWNIWQKDKGKLRAELSSISAQQTPRAQNGIGQMQERSSSSGWGLRLAGNTADERARLEWNWATSQYRAPGTLNPGFLSPPDSGNASQIQLAYDLLKDWRTGEESKWPISATVQWRQENVTRAYRSLGAGVGGDLQSWALNWNGTVGPIAWQLGRTHRQDNVTGDVNLPTNLADTTQFGLTLPLSQWAGPWLPALGYTATRAHNRMDPSRLPAFIPPAAAANLHQQQDAYDLNWTWDKWTTGLRFIHASQDNRDLTNNDTSTRSKELTWAWQTLPTLELTGSFGSAKDDSSTSGISSTRNTVQLGTNWRFGQRWTLTANLSHNNDRDDQGFQKLLGNTWSVQLGKQFDVALMGSGKQTGSFWLRLNNSRNSTLGIEPLPGLQAYSNNTRTRYATAGLSLTF
jgi:hypothetical protein